MTLSQAPTALYQGYDSFLGEGRDTAISGTSNTTSGEVSNTVYICTDSESVSDSISVSGSFSESGIDTSASAKATWVQNLNVTSTSVVVVVHTVVQIGVTQANDYNLTAAAPTSVQDFFKGYGDSFVNQLVTGAEYYAAFVYESTSTEQQESISASLKGSVGVLTASLSTTINDVSTSSNTTVSISQQALGVSTGFSLPAADPDSIVTFALQFTSLTFNAPEVLALTFMGYDNVPGLTSDFAPVAANRNLLSSLGNTVLFVDAYTTLDSLYTQVNQIQKMYTGYQYTSDPGFSSKAAQINSDYAALTALIANIESNVTGQFSPLPLPSLQYGTPDPSYVIKPMPFTASGQAFYDLSLTNILDGVTISSIVLLSAGFTVTYSNTLRFTHGSGSQQGSVTLESGDSIKLIGFPLPPPSSYQIGLVETVSGQVAGNPSGTWIEIKSPPTIIGFSGATFPSQGNTTVITLEQITITLSPTVWVSSS